MKLDCSFLIVNTTSNLFCFRNIVPESTSHEPLKSKSRTQVRVNAEEPAEHQETDVDAREEPGNTKSVEKETNVNCHEYINFVKDV